MSILLIAEHDNHQLKPQTLNLVSAGKYIGNTLDILVAGHDCHTVAEQAAQIPGIRQVYLADHTAYQHQLAENLAELVLSLAEHYSHILALASSTGKDFIPRLAALLGVNPIADIIAVESPVRFQRPIYAGNAIATIESADPFKVITVRGTAFDPVPATGGHADIVPLETLCQSDDVSFVSAQISSSERPELGSASVVVSGGRGLASEENFTVLYRIADKLGAAVGASRAAVDAGYVANELQVGQTGKMVAPQLYIAVGISGAIQHLAGMKDSKVIVAINKDPEAPIFQIADYGLVADLFQVLPELESKL